MFNLFGSETSSHGGGGHHCYSVDICPDLILAAIAAAASVAFFLLYQGITMVVGRKRRKRDDEKANLYGSQYNLGRAMYFLISLIEIPISFSLISNPS